MPNGTALLRSVHAAALPLALALALAPAALHAAEGSEDAISDLRLSYSPLMGRDWRLAGPATLVSPDTYGTTSPVSSAVAYTQTVRSHRRWELAYFYGLSDLEADRGTFLLGLSAVQDMYVTQGHSSDTSRLLDVFAGFAWAFTPDWHIEQGFLIGAGRSHYRFHSPGWYSDGSDWNADVSGLCYEYGARIGTYYTLWGRLQAGIEARYTVTVSDLHLTGSHVNTTDGTLESNDLRPTARIQGFGGLFSIGWRL